MALSRPTPDTLGASPRLVVYVGVGAAALVASLLAGRPALAAFGAPLLLAAVLGVCLARPPRLAVGPARLLPERAIAGDRLVLDVGLRVDSGPGRMDMLVALQGPAEVDGTRTGVAAWAVTDHPPDPLRAELATLDWGRVTARSATVRAYGPLGLVHWTRTASLGATARVLPDPERLRALLDPPPRATAGGHASRARGSGMDFAELRSLAPGDRLVDVNWRASARRPHHRLLVNVRHPERTGDVVLLLDTAADDADERAPWLPRAARAAWAVAQAHLGYQDRVGLVSFGGYTSWITARGGERAAYALLDKLLAVRSAVGVSRSLSWLPTRLLPTDAAIVAITPLHALHTMDALIDLRRRGRAVAALVVDTADLLPAEEALIVARRFWALEIERRLQLLRRAGIVTSRWDAGAPLAPAVALLARLDRPATTRVATAGGRPREGTRW